MFGTQSTPSPILSALISLLAKAYELYLQEHSQDKGNGYYEQTGSRA